MPVARLQPVTEDEVAALYDAYRLPWSTPTTPTTPAWPASIPRPPSPSSTRRATRTLLREPLMARLVMAAHHRRAARQPGRCGDEALPADRRRRGGYRDGFPDRQRFLQRLVKELDFASTDSLPRDAPAALPGLRPVRGQRDSPYIQLLELGVLLEEWRDDECHVRFAFDRMLEYLLAETRPATAVGGRCAGAGGAVPARGAGRDPAPATTCLVTELLDATDGAEVPAGVADW